MKKIAPLLVILFSLGIVQVYGQHKVNDIEALNGWYKVKIEIAPDNVLYFISQCYPGGDEYEIIGKEKDKLPLYLKALCMGMIEEGLKDSFDFGEMEMSQDGYLIQLSGFSLSMIFKFSKSPNEIVEDLGEEILNKYKDKIW